MGWRTVRFSPKFHPKMVLRFELRATPPRGQMTTQETTFFQLIAQGKGERWVKRHSMLFIAMSRRGQHGEEIRVRTSLTRWQSTGAVEQKR
jgi:hypothetical protein